MKYILGILVVLIAGSAIVADPAPVCDSGSCNVKDNCRCSNQDSPISGDDVASYPQLISITFDDSVTDRVYNEIINHLLLDESRINPDGAPIGATFFVPHEYTNYKRVNDLYNFGFEIGVHSISNDPHQEYWRSATEDLLVQEFQGQKHIISKFANIPEEAIIGGRTPELQLSGDRSMTAYITANLQYDSTWPSLSGHRIFPYTLDYRSTQDCLLGAECPTSAFKGFWVLPINNLRGSDRECNTLANCDIKGSAEDIANWLTDQIEQVRSTSKTPMTLMVSSGWFNYTQNSFEGFQIFMDKMKEKDDVFFVNQKQFLEFVKNPVKTSDFKTDGPPDQASCDSRTCKLKKGTEDRNMVSCTACPQVYPWVGNPDGNPSYK